MLPSRVLAALAGYLLLTAAAPATDWSTRSAKTADGAYVTGNPAAKFKLVEYASYTCPHCAKMAVDSEAELQGHMIRSGQVSLEFRHYIFNAMDLSAAVLARCSGPRGFSRSTAAIFATQATWLPVVIQWQQAHPEWQSLPQSKRLRALGVASGLVELMKRRGLSQAAIDACYADKAGVDQVTAISGATPVSVTGTPTFFLNGTQMPYVEWDQLASILRGSGVQ